MTGATILGPDDGPSYWQPVPANGHVTVKMTPEIWDGPFSMGVQVVAPGGHIRLHAHDRNKEVVFVWEGEGTAVVDGARHPMQPGTVIVLPLHVEHSFINDGAGELKLLWIMAPHGLEDFFARIGRPRVAGEPAPAPFSPAGECVADRGGNRVSPDLGVAPVSTGCAAWIRISNKKSVLMLSILALLVVGRYTLFTACRQVSGFVAYFCGGNLPVCQNSGRKSNELRLFLSQGDLLALGLPRYGTYGPDTPVRSQQ